MSETTKYWEQEDPIIAYGERNMLILFPKAKKLQIAVIWDEAPNPRRQGKTVTLGEQDMNQEMRDALAGFLDSLVIE